MRLASCEYLLMPTARTARIAQLETLIAEIVDVLPDSEEQEHAWLSRDLAEFRAELDGLYDAQRADDAARRFKRTARAISKQAEALRVAYLLTADEIRAIATKLISRAYKSHNASAVPGHDPSIAVEALCEDIRAARESALEWLRFKRECEISDLAVRSRRVREQTDAERAFDAELRIAFRS